MKILRQIKGVFFLVVVVLSMGCASKSLPVAPTQSQSIPSPQPVQQVQPEQKQVPAIDLSSVPLNYMNFKSGYSINYPIGWSIDETQADKEGSPVFIKSDPSLGAVIWVYNCSLDDMIQSIRSNFKVGVITGKISLLDDRQETGQWDWYFSYFMISDNILLEQYIKAKNGYVYKLSGVEVQDYWGDPPDRSKIHYSKEIADIAATFSIFK